MIQHGEAPFLECSSKGDRRFSAFYARIRSRGNKSIEDLYQGAKIFADGATGLDWRAAKGRAAINMNEVAKLYSTMWREYIAENPNLIPVLTAHSGTSDVFGQKGHVCQATELWAIRAEHLALQKQPETIAAADAEADFFPITDKPVRLGIIGTAGRKDDAPRLTKASFDRMVDMARDVAKQNHVTHLVSGGAAWADHVAVVLALEGLVPPQNLTLRLPAPLRANGFDESSRDGSTSNYYHRLFREKTGRNSIADLVAITQKGAVATVGAGGFFARNTEVANDATLMLAFTFGHGQTWEAERFPAGTSGAAAKLKDGGTKDTWEKTRAEKIHITLGPDDYIVPAAKANDAPAPTSSIVAVTPEPVTTQVLNKHASGVPADAIYIGRGGKPFAGQDLGNPYPINDAIGQTREIVIQRQAENLARNPALLEAVKRTKGHKLVCFCAPKICHGDVYAFIAEGIEKDPIKAGLLVTRDHMTIAKWTQSQDNMSHSPNRAVNSEEQAAQPEINPMRAALMRRSKSGMGR